jgi:hypothetical protein
MVMLSLPHTLPCEIKTVRKLITRLFCKSVNFRWYSRKGREYLRFVYMKSILETSKNAYKLSV